MERKDSLGDRMKMYENKNRIYLERKTPVIIRIDGKAFHTFTRGFARPFDDVFLQSMRDTMIYLCENVQNCIIGYTQSDEITLFLNDYQTEKTDAWFEYNIQKLTSISASMATLAFNKAFKQNYKNWVHKTFEEWKPIGHPDCALADAYKTSIEHGAIFDSRCFNLPEDEVINCFIWRQQDAIRNSIQQVAQSKYSHNQLMNKNTAQLKEMLLANFNISWDDIPLEYQRGVCAIRVEEERNGVMRHKWIIDKNIPLFTENRNYGGL